MNRDMLPPDWTGVMLVITSAAGFSTLAILAKLAYEVNLNLPSILVFRFGGTALILWTWLLLRNQWQLPIGKAVKAMLLGAVGYAIQATVFFTALLYTDASVATLLFYTYPAFVTLLAWLVEHEVPTRARKIALGIALIGCVFISDLSQASVAPLGILFGIASGVWYSLYLTFGSRLVKSVEPVVTSAYVALGATVSFGVATLMTSHFTIPDSGRGFSIIVGIAVLATALPIVTLFSGMQKIGTTRTAIVSTVEPLLTVMLGILILGEQMQGGQIWGGVLIMASVVLANWKSAATES
ncbi:MAG: DMT family transporter [Phormidesmis sp.]